MALATVLYYDYLLTLPDEVSAVFTWEVPLLTRSRYDMHGKGRNRGVGYASFECSNHYVKPSEVFVIFILVRTVTHFGLR